MMAKAPHGNGVAFTDCASAKYDFKVHPFNRICTAQGIKYKLTKSYHPWTNGQAERMNRTLKKPILIVHSTTRSRPKGNPPSSPEMPTPLVPPI